MGRPLNHKYFGWRNVGLDGNDLAVDARNARKGRSFVQRKIELRFDIYDPWILQFSFSIYCVFL